MLTIHWGSPTNKKKQQTFLLTFTVIKIVTMNVSVTQLYAIFVSTGPYDLHEQLVLTLSECVITRLYEHSSE